MPDLPGNQTTVQLTDTVSIPIIGLGTWAIRGKHGRQAMESALEIGYRHIDTASIYNNEKQVGAAVKASGLPRDEVFITSKVWNNNHGYDSALRACDASLKRLGMEQVDLYLIHWPGGGKLEETWKALEQLLAEGKARSIGVSNYGASHLRAMLDYATVKPCLNQIELHPWNQHRQQDTIDFCHEHGIHVQAYTPLNKGRRYNNATLQAVAGRHVKGVGQVILRWDVQHEYITIPKASSLEHQRGNLDIFDFELSEEEMAAIDTVG